MKIKKLFFLLAVFFITVSILLTIIPGISFAISISELERDAPEVEEFKKT